MKRYMVIFLLLTAVMTGFADSEELDIYTYLYDGAATVTDQLGILQSVAELGLSGAGDFYNRALNRLVREYPTIRDTLEKEASDNAVILLAGCLGDAKYTAAAGDLWRAVEAFSNPLVKAEAIMALGKMRATAFLPQVIQTLSDLNTRPAADRLAGERVAFGAIIALEKYQDVSGYLPVFFASTGWYSERIKQQAAASLPVILADPSDPLSSVIKGSGYPYTAKFLALQTIESSNVSNGSKAAIALTAFTEGWRASTNDVRLRMDLASMRKQAIDMIRRYGTSDAAVYPLLERSYKEGIDAEERLSAVATLSSLGTEDSARLLSSFLMIINGKLQSGTLTQVDEQMVRAIIPALGATGQAVGRPALRSVQALDWTNAVKNLATEALGNIK
jgi:HEAT repeat protein